MSSVMTLPPTAPIPPEGGRIPPWVTDLDSFRRWAWSDEFPDHGQFSFLDSEIWVDLTMEELWTHNQVKVAYTYAIVSLQKLECRGRFVADRMLLTNPVANLSTEPDGLFYLWQTWESGRLREVRRGKKESVLELEGTPDMLLEIVSDSSVRKDTVRLRELYWKAQVPEYWLVDVRSQNFLFDILLRGPEGYTPAQVQDGWVQSALFERQFRLVRSADKLGKPEYELLHRS